MKKWMKTTTGLLTMMISATLAFQGTAVPSFARTEAEAANNAVICYSALAHTLPVASGMQDVTADGAVTGWTAILDPAEEYEPLAARFATLQAEEAVSVLRMTLPGAAVQKTDLTVSLWSPSITADSCLRAYLYENGAWVMLPVSLRKEHIDLELTGRDGGVIALTRASAFRYQHNPAANPKVLKDAIVNPDAVYGFSPNPDSTRLKDYVDALDWTDPVAVAEAKKAREDYHARDAELYRLIRELLSKGRDVETIARAASRRRNELRLESYSNNPEGLEIVKRSNLATYGHEEGPTAESLYARYGSWQTVLEKALSANAGMDACLGLYDDYYDIHMLNP